MERNISLDVLKVILAFFIIALHGKIFQDINPELSFFTVNGIFRIGVPIVLIVSGFFFYYVKDLTVWVKRVFALYATWMVFYAYFYFEMPTNISSLAKDLLFIFFGYHHLWYLAGTLLGGILLYLARNLSTRLQLVSALVFFIGGVSMQYVGNMHVLPSILDKAFNFYPVHRNFLTVCYPFLMLGFLIKKHDIANMLKHGWLFACLAIALLYVEVFFNYKFISSTEPLDGMFALFIACPLIFLACMNMNIKGKGKSIALFSTALYLIHPFFQNILQQFNVNSVSSFLLTILFSSIASVFLILLSKKVKFIL
ncbi:TPA: acyltransferase family protein [Acinetobacter baumannii]|uniref:acyltransferase family protein n=1 Tax=Acinetobacter baumannii TaxID=470 RepID=UPI0001E2B4F9|nr:acyltransferase family protein [Acinetobacter baumannii]EHU2436766.1 acyltransferase family protein [Acinetobacter baumannii]EHU2880887.1 acyltransferase family protein [Acinetobacter baumannii]EHU2888104.1 acyltransferase family protein [Acinetobacter baumannii]EHU3155671.1 acyltransferase family protein [Acinetobacter baumannii]EIB7025611.1 acyltransferase family protein [Acinetobacter baumannii]